MRVELASSFEGPGISWAHGDKVTVGEDDATRMIGRELAYELDENDERLPEDEARRRQAIREEALAAKLAKQREREAEKARRGKGERATR